MAAYIYKILKSICGNVGAFCCNNILHSGIKQDMEEIIHCKDCKFCKWRCSYVCENRDAPWNQGSEYSSVFINEDDFCSYAEQREKVFYS